MPNIYSAFVFCLLLFSMQVTALAEDASLVEKGSVDLLKSELFSRPFTTFDQLLYSLTKEADAKAKYFRPDKNDFKSLEGYEPTADVVYEKTIFRVGVTFTATVTAMNDPWREVCEKHVRTMALTLGVLVPSTKQPDMDDDQIRFVFSRYLGPKVTLENMPVASLRPFLDAVVVIGKFSVATPDRKGLAYLRQCVLDNKTDRMTYFEHKY